MDASHLRAPAVEEVPYMSDIRDDFRATVENVSEDAEELKTIERQKADLDPADPRARTLSEKAEELAEELHQKTQIERDLTENAAESA
jgi:hypothetical protein